MIDLTDDDLRQIYLNDLKYTLVEYNGAKHPKVKNPGAWEQFKPISATGHYHPVPLDGNIKVWVWSDQHFGHENIIKYANRPFPNAALMNECMVGNYSNAVRPGDIVIFGGDVAFGNTHILNEVLLKLPGYKILILGNHDLRHEMYKQMNFNEIVISRVLKYPLVEDRFVNVAFTHIPIGDVDTEIEANTLFFHGHLHNKTTGRDRDINFCVEHTNYGPVLLTDLIKQAINTHPHLRLLNNPLY
jgi:calcineurin-like phosphoesterase family protein